jgi:hypothetical protein
MAEAGQFENLLGLCSPCSVTRNRGMVMGLEPSGDRRADDITNEVKTEVHQPIRYVLCRSFVREKT